MAETVATPSTGTPLPSTRTWDGAASPGAAGVVRRFEAAWNASTTGRRPDPRAFLPEEPSARPAALLALLRSEIGLRWDGPQRATVEHYRDAYPELDPDGLVALVYEEFCLREEEGEAPVPIEYDERFPELTNRLRRVFDIHDLVGSGGSAAFRMPSTPEVPFPESGQTTAGFRLLEELGRGSFARVFLAEERQLADRPVALKVSRTGSREPQTLARLQHTHIVPVHSYRTDPATGLHLLCMPYFGRVTLERLMAGSGFQKARNGAEVLTALDGLGGAGGAVAPAVRSAFGRLPFARAIAWWGARMAEALAHAHERGVLHRDIKPSNVLITADGLPMLLDFNLARDPLAESEGASVGGTLAYMAPEHLDALAAGHDGAVDHRADVYALGVLLFEVLTGRRPFAVPKGAGSVAEALARAADDRRRTRPTIRSTHPEIPACLEAVVLKCLAVDPSRRHPDASALAADLDAVAEDGPLVHAREPFASRSVRWSRRNRWPLALASTAAMAWIFLGNAVFEARDDQHRVVATLSRWIEGGGRLADSGDLHGATVRYVDAVELAEGTPDFARQPPLIALRDRARDQLGLVELAGRLSGTAARLRADRPGSLAERRGAILAIDVAVAPVLSGSFHPGSQEAGHSGLSARARREAEELLFMRAILDGRPAGSGALRGEGLSGVDPAPWKALRSRLAGGRDSVPRPDRSATSDPQACLLFGLLAEADGRPDVALAWLERAATLAPDRDDLDASIARLAIRAGDPSAAIDHAARQARNRRPD